MQLNEGQAQASQEIQDWFKSGNDQLYKLAGWAGTGKTYTAVQTIKQLKLRKSHVVFATFTGKASLVLTRYLEDGTHEVTTIHKLIYDTVQDYMLDTYRFELKKALGNARLIVIDEASQVSSTIEADLKSFGLPILAIGDMGQLPAIETPDKYGFIGTSKFLENPNFVLDEIMRQHKDSKILELATRARKQQEIPVGVYSDLVRVVRKEDLTIEDYARAGQVICGYNATIASKTAEIREFLGFEQGVPSIGDKVLITKSNARIKEHGYPLLNGMIGYLTTTPKFTQRGKMPDLSPLALESLGMYADRDIYEVHFQPDFLDKPFTQKLYVPTTDFSFQRDLLDLSVENYFNRMEFANLISCHKAQGDQFDDVLVLDESFGEDAWRWLYTAITRARTSLTLAI